jgi:L-glutamine:2-deoxy-scyllo-inosose/3-amino-2,3-dideoxy-scyllo-inosose aminotransferase
MAYLAVLGGAPSGHFRTPRWPQPAPTAASRVRDVLENGFWSSPLPGQSGPPAASAQFARHFAEFIGVPFCVPVMNGSSALVVALEALDVGAGDEVVIPGLTWLANATTVLRVNATPVMVDVDPATLCASPAAIEAAITERTKAIVVVHLYSSVADLDAVLAIGERHGIPVIEDCSHAHGAAWKGRRVGSWGAVGTFSMQAKKLLTAGEGGATVCRTESLYDRLFQAHSDGRLPPDGTGSQTSDRSGGTLTSGANHRISEIGAAVLDAQLESLPEQNRQRAANAAVVDKLLADVEGLILSLARPSVTERTYYYYWLRIEPEAFGGVSAGTVCEALTAEIGLPFQPTYLPLYRDPQYRPHKHRRFRVEGINPALLHGPPGGLPEIERARREVVTFHHPALLSDDTTAFEALPEAIRKLQRNIRELQDYEAERVRLP